MEDSALINFQKQQILTLQEEKAAAMEALDLARELGSFTAISQPTRKELLREICVRANKMISFQSCAVYLVDSDTQDFIQATCLPDGTGDLLEHEISSLISDQSFAFALQSEGPVFFLDSSRNNYVLLHSLATPFRVRGMFAGIMFQGKDEILDTTLKLFSVVMHSAVNALENLETHDFMRNHSQELELRVQRRTQELADAYERMNVTLNGMQAGVLVIDAATHQIVDANPKALELLGRPLGEVIGKQCFDMICYSLRGECPMTDKGLDENNAEYLIRRPDGVSIPVQKTASKVMIGGRLHLVENFIDISEQKKLADLKEDVDRIMRHDLKGPLNGIIGLPEVLLMDLENVLDDGQREILEHIRGAGYKLLNMINLSLDLYKMETGTYNYRPVDVDFYPMLRGVLKDLSEHIYWKKIEVKVLFEGADADCDLTFHINSDESLLYSLLSNLLKNAVEASPSGETVVVDISRRADSSVMRIHNMGAVPEDIRENFFDKYVTAGKSGGTGLGTYSARLVAETIGGRISFESSEELGTSVSVEFFSAGE
ncbi:ATP-binding protein [Maridesulfovibrio sp.]|uniref:ATP-binding protein n=1 Tax=Maridesulfovibrio sp. TaxID=2795000 RepID=UPI002A187294|nr:ATP-binding protein [Maridesulfovibrio sp.]